MESRSATSPGSWGLIVAFASCVAAIAAAAPNPSWWPVLVAAAICAGGLTALIWWRGDVSLFLVIGGALIFRLALVWLPPTLSDDAYRYVWDGYLQSEGINPYEYPPAAAELQAYHDEPVYDQLNSKSYYSVYPPLSQLIFRVGAFAYDHGWRTSYFVIKGIFAALEFGAVLVLSQLVGPAALLLYAWNPLVLLAGAGQAHGESALVFFLGLTLLAAKKGRGGSAAVWLACAGWIKLYPFVLFPLLWRRFGWRSAAVGVTVTAALAAPYVHPSVVRNVLDSLDLYVRFFEFNAGFYYLVKEVFELLTGEDWSKQIGPAFRVAFLGLLPVIYLLDWRRDWALQRSFTVVIGAFFLLSTTVHPWYLLGILVVVASVANAAWHWQWLSIWSLGTYLLYIGGPYWIWVNVGWIGWAVLAWVRYRRSLIDGIMTYRARGKADLLAPLIQRGESILDLGAGEGFVAKRLEAQRRVVAELVDVVDMNRSNLPHRVYDGEHLPYHDSAFDSVLLVYVLHHAEKPTAVIREAVRVSRRRVLILESTFHHAWERRFLELADRLINRIRSAGRMNTSKLQFRTLDDWTTLFEEMDIPVVARRDLGGFIHYRALFILDAAQKEDSEAIGLHSRSRDDE